MKLIKKHSEIKANIDLLAENSTLKEKEEFNIFYVNTPRGRVKIKSNLSLEEFKNQFKK